MKRTQLRTGNYQIYRGKIHRHDRTHCRTSWGNDYYLCGIGVADDGKNQDTKTTKNVTCRHCLKKLLQLRTRKI